jgi:dephospho-CoA kinase
VISSDEIVHRLLREPPVRDAIITRFGREVLGAGDEIDRGRVADVVFADPDELEWLETLLHPRVVSTYLAWREELGEREDPPAVCVTEVPLLYEVGGEDRFDAVVAVTAAPEVRASRHVRPMMEREGRLLPDSEKLARADFTFVNDGTLGELDAFVSDVMARVGAST